MTSCKKCLAGLGSALHREVTKPRGFRKQGLTARRAIGGEPFGLLHTLHVQGSSGNAAGRCVAYINVGTALVFAGEDAASPFGFRVTRDGGAEDRWPVGEVPDATVIEAARVQAGAWFDAHTEPVSFFRREEAKVLGQPIDAWVGFVDTMCRGWVALDERDKAADALRGKLAFFARERPHADPQIVVRFARSLALEL